MDRISMCKVLLSHSSHGLIARAERWNSSMSEMINKPATSEEWRIQMLPINFLFLTVWPVVEMRLRCKSGGRDYPPGVPEEITKVLELDVVRWKLQGLDNIFQPSEFSLGVKGALYPDRRGARTRLKGQLEMNISFVLPPVLAMVPENVRKPVAETVLRELVENMKRKVNSSLLTDYSKFKQEKPKNRLSDCAIAPVNCLRCALGEWQCFDSENSLIHPTRFQSYLLADESDCRK
uniref:Uncharacterized protein n=1 Tax=Salix viminalis TaxID=40686 RepID=A0A6N2LB96_SALVM